MGETKGTQEVIIELKDSLAEIRRFLRWQAEELSEMLKDVKPAKIKRFLKWKAKELTEMLEDVKPAKIKRFLKWKAKELTEYLDQAAKEENKEESAYEITSTAYLAAITVFVLAGILFHL
jgi:hypothetical protein